MAVSHLVAPDLPPTMRESLVGASGARGFGDGVLYEGGSEERWHKLVLLHVRHDLQVACCAVRALPTIVAVYSE